MKHLRSIAKIAAAGAILAGCSGSVRDLQKQTATVFTSSEKSSETSRRTMPKDAEAPLFTDLGNYHYPITTKSELAQKYFDQGLTLAYGFNHAESAR